jgi:hypothetical protein
MRHRSARRVFVLTAVESRLTVVAVAARCRGGLGLSQAFIVVKLLAHLATFSSAAAISASVSGFLDRVRVDIVIVKMSSRN